jgi:hypothetical protein
MITTNENIDISAIAFHSTDNPSNFAEQINSYDNNLVIDIGCGSNFWKNKINNLIGFDHNSKFEGQADKVCSFEDFNKTIEKESVDFLLMLGSVNNPQAIKNMHLCFSWLKPGGKIVMRVRKNKFWNKQKIADLSTQYNLNMYKELEQRELFLNDLEEKDIDLMKSTVSTSEELDRIEESLAIGIAFKTWYVWWWEKNV